MERAVVGRPKWRGEFALPAATRKPFAVAATRPLSSRRLHLVAEVCTVWARGKLVRIAARTKCGRDLGAVRLYDEEPEVFSRCDYCNLAVELTPFGYSASVILARMDWASVRSVSKQRVA